MVKHAPAAPSVVPSLLAEGVSISKQGGEFAADEGGPAVAVHLGPARRGFPALDVGAAGGRYGEAEDSPDSRPSLGSPGWDFSRPTSASSAEPLSPSLLRMCNDSRGSCGPLWASHERLDDVLRQARGVSPGFSPRHPEQSLSH
mmetsp:Transcript_22335/g.75843  ORF Transcript_22335/g.75843 Transcript_22335/m.75843 type:complete len:144 (-) Transcript_22335:79-510(-)